MPPRGLVASWAIAASALAGCGLPGANEVAGEPVNACSANGDCSSDAACVAGRCVATSYDLTGLLLQVTVNPSAGYAAGASFLFDPSSQVVLRSNGSHDSPFANQFSPPLDTLVSLTGALVVLDPSYPASCGAAADHSVPANVTFYRVPPFAGLPFNPVYASTNMTASASASYAFDVDLVAGPNDVYDVYIQPVQLAGCPIAIPPYLVPGKQITAGPHMLLAQLPPAGTLKGMIDGFTVGSPPEWQLDVVEPSRGLVISAVSTFPKVLHALTPINGGGATIATQFSPLVDPTQSPLLRLSPITKDGTIDTKRPTVFWSLAGAISGGTATDPEVKLTNDLLASGVKVEGQIYGSDGVTGVPSQLTIQSTMLDSTDLAFNASYTVNVTSAGSPAPPGQFEVNLPPGDYTLRVTPIASNGLAVTDESLTWPATGGPTTCVCGRSFKLKPKASFDGNVTTPTGAPFTATTLQVVGSVTPARTYLESTHVLSSLPSRQMQTTTDGGGSYFSLIDLGVSDLVVQPDPATSYPWLVVPRFKPGPEPGSYAVTNPAFLGGTLVDPTGAPVANAEVDAWLPVIDPATGKQVGTVVMIATTSTDADGSYRLVLPSSLTAPTTAH